MSLNFQTYLILSEVLDANTEELLKKYQHYDPTALGGKEQAEKAKQDFIKKMMDDPQQFSKEDAFRRLQQQFPSIKRKAALRGSLLQDDSPKLQKYKTMLANKQITVPMYKTIKYFADKGVDELAFDTFVQEIKDAESSNDLKLYFKDKPNLVKVYGADLGNVKHKNIGEFDNWDEFTTNLHANAAKKEKSDYADPEVLWETYPQNRVMKKNGIYVFKAFNFQQCRILGKGQSWCISNWPSYYLSYRHNRGQSQYFIFDTNKSPDDPARYVNPGVADQSQEKSYGYSSEWVDKNNRPDHINGYKSVEEYKDYLEGKGFPKSLWTADPLTTAEIKANEFVRGANYASNQKWFDVMQDKEVADNILTLVDHMPMDVFKGLEEQQKLQFLSGKESYKNQEIQQYLETLPLNTLRSYVRTLLPHHYLVSTLVMPTKLSKAFALEYNPHYFNLISPETWEAMSPENKDKYLEGLHIGGATVELLRKMTPEERDRVFTQSLQERDSLDNKDFEKIYENGFTELVKKYVENGYPIGETQFDTISKDPDLVDRYFKARIEKNKEDSNLTHKSAHYHLAPYESKWLIENDKFDILNDRIGYRHNLHPVHFKKISHLHDISKKYITKALKYGRQLSPIETDFLINHEMLEENWQLLGSQIFLNAEQLEKLWNDSRLTEDNKKFLITEYFRKKAKSEYGKSHIHSINHADRMFMIKHDMWDAIEELVYHTSDTPFMNAELDLMAKKPDLLKKYLNYRMAKIEANKGYTAIPSSNKEFELFSDEQKQSILEHAQADYLQALLTKNYTALSDLIAEEPNWRSKDHLIRSFVLWGLRNEDKDLIEKASLLATKDQADIKYSDLAEAINDGASLDFIKFLLPRVDSDIDSIIADNVKKQGLSDVVKLMMQDRMAGCETYQQIADSVKIDDADKKKILIYSYKKDFEKPDISDDEALDGVFKEIKFCGNYADYNASSVLHTQKIPSIINRYQNKINALKELK